MESNGKNAGTMTVTPSKSKLSSKSKLLENVNPNVTSPNSKASNSPSIKSATKIHKSAVKKPNPIKLQSPKNKIRERKFVVVKKKPKTLDSVNCKCKTNLNSSKCLCVAYDTLRASQDDFFKNRSEDVVENPNLVMGIDGEILETSGEKRRRDKLMEVTRQSVPESGRVMHLVKAFENILTLPKSDDNDGEKEQKGEEVEEERTKSDSKWEYSWSFCASDLLLTAENLRLRGSRVSSSLDSNHGRTSGGGRQSRRNISELTSSFGGRRWKRTVRATSQQPFKLRTEQRGKEKQEEFMKKVQEMMIEQEKQRIPVAQGLPWTTDEPECLVKPPVKESTKPVDLVFHSDARAMERAEFDHQVQEKLSFIEQYKLEREKQQKLEEEEELNRLRMELVPKAQPMPYFDRPFMPRRAIKSTDRPYQPTIPKEPKFHNPTA